MTNRDKAKESIESIGLVAGGDLPKARRDMEIQTFEDNVFTVSDYDVDIGLTDKQIVKIVKDVKYMMDLEASEQVKKELENLKNEGKLDKDQMQHRVLQVVMGIAQIEKQRLEKEKAEEKQRWVEEKQRIEQEQEQEQKKEQDKDEGEDEDEVFYSLVKEAMDIEENQKIVKEPMILEDNQKIATIDTKINRLDVLNTELLVKLNHTLDIINNKNEQDQKLSNKESEALKVEKSTSRQVLKVLKSTIKWGIITLGVVMLIMLWVKFIPIVNSYVDLFIIPWVDNTLTPYIIDELGVLGVWISKGVKYLIGFLVN